MGCKKGVQVVPLGRGLGFGSVWLSCHDSSSHVTLVVTHSSASEHQDGEAEWNTQGAWDEWLFLTTCRPEKTCPGQASCTVSRLGLIYVVAELADSKGSYVIRLCGKIGEGGMERKRVNNSIVPGVSGPWFEQRRLLLMLVEGQDCLRVSHHLHSPKKWATCFILFFRLESEKAQPTVALPMCILFFFSGIEERPVPIQGVFAIVVSNLSKNTCIKGSSRSQFEIKYTFCSEKKKNLRKNKREREKIYCLDIPGVAFSPPFTPTPPPQRPA